MACIRNDDEPFYIGANNWGSQGAMPLPLRGDPAYNPWHFGTGSSKDNSEMMLRQRIQLQQNRARHPTRPQVWSTEADAVAVTSESG